MNRQMVASLAAMAALVSARAADVFFQGTSDAASWFEAANWKTGALPGAGDVVLFGSANDGDVRRVSALFDPSAQNPQGAQEASVANMMLAFGAGDGTAADRLGGTLTVKSGALTVAGNFWAGGWYADANLYLRGGTMTVNGEFLLGRYPFSKSLVDIADGTLAVKGAAVNGGLTIGGPEWTYDSTIAVSRTGVLHSERPVFVGYGDSGTATLNVTDGGTVIAPRILAPNAKTVSTVCFDGGVVKGVVSENKWEGFLEYYQPTWGGLRIGPKGLVLDTGTTPAYNDFTTDALDAAGPVVKKGAGLWTTPTLNYPCGVKVAEGAVRLTRPNLRHRYSFNGSCADDVTGASPRVENASLNADGTLEIEKDSVVCFGEGSVPRGKEATIEIWFKNKSFTENWDRILTVGSCVDGERDLLSLAAGQVANWVLNSFVTGGNQNHGWRYWLNGANVGRRFHVAISIKTEDGTTTVSYSMRNIDGNDDFCRWTQTTTAWSLEKSLAGLWIGKNPWNFPAAGMAVDELRVWNKALTDDEVLASYQSGPDSLPASLVATATAKPSAASVSFAADDRIASVIGEDHLAHRYTFNGTLADAVTGAVPEAKDIAVNADGQTCELVQTSTAAFGQALPKRDTVTIETWFTVHDVDTAKWDQFLTLGDGTTADLLVLCTGQNDQKVMAVTSNGQDVEFQWLHRWTAERRYHVTIVITPKEDSGSTLTLYARNADTGEAYETLVCKTAFSPVTSAGNVYLGTNPWNFRTGRLTLDELRIWDVAFTQEMVAQSTARGADHPPAFLGPAVEIAPGAQLEVAAGAVLKGNVILNPGAQIVGNGDLDLSQATLIVRDARSVASYLKQNDVWQVVVVPPGAALTGFGGIKKVRSSLIRRKDGGIELYRRGSVLIIR